MSRFLRIVFCLAMMAAAAVLPSAAKAATVHVGQLGDCCYSEFPIYFDAGPGEQNEVHLYLEMRNYDSLTMKLLVVDNGAPVTVGDGCTSLDSHTARCGPPPQTEVFFNAHVDLGDMDDELYAGAACGSFILEEEFLCGVDANGGDGDDLLYSPDAGYGDLHGGPGKDCLVAGDIVNYDTNKSSLEGGLGNDLLTGFKRPFDVASYADRTARIVVSLKDGEGGDPMIGERDRIVGVLGATGGDGNDALTGNRRANWLYGGDGGDLIRGRGGADYVSGGLGNDVLGGGPGKDYITGYRGNDELWSLDGTKDRVIGGRGTDRARRDYHLDVLSSVERFF